MANTFTGLKLQGQIGKFGAKELSDIEGWCLLYQFFYREEFFLGGGSEKCLWKIKTYDQELCIAQEPKCTYFYVF